MFVTRPGKQPWSTTGEQPMKAIQIKGNTSFYLEARGSKMTLEWDSTFQAWAMYTDNASHRAWRGVGVRLMNSLEEVETKYKSWRGISVLAKNLERMNLETLN
jgi:hypothetical protein